MTATAFGHRVTLAYDLPAGGPYRVVRQQAAEEQVSNLRCIQLDTQKITELMRRRCLSITRLAQAAGLSRQTLANTLHDEHASGRTLTRLARALGMKAEALKL